MSCPTCGAANEPGRKFRGECGTPLAAPSVAAATGGRTAPPVSQASGGVAGPVAERRLVSVLFADLVGFTTLSEGRDPEAVRELLSRYFDLASETIRRYG